MRLSNRVLTPLSIRVVSLVDFRCSSNYFNILAPIV